MPRLCCHPCSPLIVGRDARVAQVINIGATPTKALYACGKCVQPVIVTIYIHWRLSLKSLCQLLKMHTDTSGTSKALALSFFPLLPDFLVTSRALESFFCQTMVILDDSSSPMAMACSDSRHRSLPMARALHQDHRTITWDQVMCSRRMYIYMFFERS